MDHKNKHLHPIFEEVNSVFSSHHVAATLKNRKRSFIELLHSDVSKLVITKTGSN